MAGMADLTVMRYKYRADTAKTTEFPPQALFNQRVFSLSVGVSHMFLGEPLPNYDLMETVCQQQPANRFRWFVSTTLKDFFLIVSVLGVFSIKLAPQYIQWVIPFVLICILVFFCVQLFFKNTPKENPPPPNIRLIGNVLEYSTTKSSRKIALNRSVVSFASSPKSVLVMMIDDGKNSVVVGRMADPHEICHLPIYKDDFTEISSSDFEKIFFASHKFYPSA